MVRWPGAGWRDHIETVATALSGAAKDEEDDAIRPGSD